MTAIIIPFRDRGVDPLRAANLERVIHHWSLFDGEVIIADDGRSGAAQFNRSAAYNRGAARTEADMLVYAEADMLIHYDQIDKAVRLAGEKPGLVVPFTHQKKLSPSDSERVRALKISPPSCTPMPHPFGETNNYGCINVLSRATLQSIGRWDEQFEGNAHDDCAMWQAFTVAAGPTRWVDGPAYHLFHFESVRPQDKAATQRNYRRMQIYCQAKTPEQVRHLTAGGKSLSRNWRGKLI